MKSRVKDHQSDGEEEEEVKEEQKTNKKQLSKEELEKRQLENAVVIADSEISPAAYLF